MNLFDEVLFVGPSYTSRGGISAVLQLYKENIAPFHYIKSSTNKGLLVNVCVLGTLLAKLVFIRCLGRIKILHLHGASQRSFQRKAIVIAWAKILGFKIIFHCHGGGFKDYVEDRGVRPIKKVLDKCDAIVVLSEYWRNYFTNALKQQRVFVVNNMVNRPRKVYNKADDKLHLLFLGLITREKGIFDLLEVMCDHKKELKNRCILMIGGSGREENIRSLLQYITANELQDLVDYRGWVSRETKESAFGDSNVFILPSYKEGLPISILEAMSHKMPIISTCVGGIPAVVTATNGTLMNPGDKSAIWKAIKNYMDNKDLVTKQGKESGKLIESFYPEKVKQQLLSIYSQL